MKQFNLNKGVKGSRTIQERTLHFAYMMSRHSRAHALTFWQRHGGKATEDAFSVSVRTLYRWQTALDKAGGWIRGVKP